MTRLAIFGASGDLTSRYLMPALARLEAEDLLPRDLAIVAVDRQPWDDARFTEHIRTKMPVDLTSDAARRVCERVTYARADVTSRDQVASALGDDPGDVVVYLALPPHLLPDVVDVLGGSNLGTGSLIVVEKPFGTDLNSARRLNRLLHSYFREEQVFRIDHFVHKQMVQNILGLRFANRIFEPVWDARHIERVDIIWEETLGLEDRASYYDRSGALRDMIQNHLLQLLCLVAMEPPASLHERDLRDAKVAVLRAVPTLTEEEVARSSVRARYSAGSSRGRAIPAYVDDEGIDPERGTETFAEVTLRVANWRWADTPFRLRSGKALGRDHAEIAIHFRPVPHLAFAPSGSRANVLHIEFDPDRLVIEIDINGPGDPFELEHAELDADLHDEGLPAYSRLLLEVLGCDPALSIRADEAEEAWRIVEPILEAWQRGAVPLLEYPAGSDGPTWRDA
ncbi:MAG TPA: glucose-6-phosphate dehydrogenase [Actinomycetota bacterium]|jgi:glucose-6-phosphate 1-dehydrogenase|nr:glucose-6-phosphate dehydrogenase [Actinomycetota bacterium]